MSDEQVINVGHALISFNRAESGAYLPCVFCERMTKRGLAHRLITDAVGEWKFLNMCDNCHDAIKKIPTNNTLKVEGKPGDIIVG